MRLTDYWRILTVTSTSLALAACLSFQSSTVSKNPVAVPTQLFSAATEEGSSKQSDNSTVSSIDQKINSGAYNAAEQQLASLASQASEDTTLKMNVAILQSKLQLLTGNPEKALSYLDQMPNIPSLTPEQQHYLSQLRSQAYYRTDQVLFSAISDTQDNASITSIWNKLLQVNPSTLQTQGSEQTDTLTRAWLNLAEVAENNANHFEILKKSLLTWQQTYPQHPGNQLLTNINSSEKVNTQSIAVILPLSGNYLNLGKTIQRGILAAYYASSTKNQQSITFYDSQADTIDHIYQQIKAQNNTVILGPLTKENTEELLSIAQESPRIISLNYTNTTMPSSHLEFGLSPEDEARQIAELAWRKGKSSALIIAPQTEKGEQTVNAFINTWNTLGGQTVDRYNYKNTDDFSKSIAALLEVTDSKWRQHLIHTALQLRITSVPYFRKDADMVFLIAEPNIARQIRPFIKFYAGDAIQVFATSSVYSGRNDPSHDKDLNDIYFCDMPAILNTNKQQEDRLYFLGKDAYLLLTQQMHLNTLPLFPLNGETGNLSVNTTTHDIQRELTCAQFKDGRPALINSTREGTEN